MNLLRLNNNKRKNLNSLSLKNRLWLMQGGLVAILTIGTVIIIFSANIPQILNSGPYKNIRQELNHESSILQQRYSLMYVNALDLAHKVNSMLDVTLNKKGLSAKDIKSHPEVIEELLENEVGISTNAMEKAGCSGVYLILDATINPALPDAKDSKGGIYIKDTNANFFPFQNNKYYLYRGSKKIARKFGMYLDSQWQLEYNIAPSATNTDSSIFTKPFTAALINKNVDLQNLGYWSSIDYPGQQTTKVITFSVPLIDNDGMVYGVCGLEMSEYFLQSYFNNTNHLFNSLSFIFSNEEQDHINIQKSLLLGGLPISILSQNGNYLKAETLEKDNQFQYFTYDTNKKNKIIGIIQQLDIYPRDSVFKNDKWCLFVFLQPDDIKNSLYLIMAINIFALLLIGVIISYFISRFYSGRITKTFKQIMEHPTQIDVTHIPEIDDLVEFLKREYISVDETVDYQSSESIDEQYSEFLGKINNLSKTEKEIFNLYIQGLSAKQICELRYISINTIKTHNKNIYKKLNVRSRAELLENFNKRRQEISID